jgi:hypothetical protein
MRSWRLLERELAGIYTAAWLKSPERAILFTPCATEGLCGVGAEAGTGLVRTWVDCAALDPAKGE